MTYRISNDIARRPGRRILPAALSLALMVLLAGCGPFGAPPGEAGTAPDSYTGTLVDPPKDLADFTLTSHTGAPLRLSELRGRPVLLFFGYTNCPDVCPTTLGEWKAVKTRLGDAAGNVAFLFVGVDTKRDTPEALARFVGKFDPAFTGLTGDEETLRAMGKDYGLYFDSHGAAGGDAGHQHETAGSSAAYVVSHSPASYLINAQGQLRKIYSYGVAADVIGADIRELLAEG